MLLSRGSCKVPYADRECVVTVCTLILPDKIPVKQNTCAGSASNRASERASMHTRLHSVNSKAYPRACVRIKKRLCLASNKSRK